MPESSWSHVPAWAISSAMLEFHFRSSKPGIVRDPVDGEFGESGALYLTRACGLRPGT
jgi:hypothetical protein